MPYVNDYSNFIKITGAQEGKLISLAWASYVKFYGKKLDYDWYLKEQLRIVPESEGYEYCVSRPEKKMYKIVELK